MKNISIRFYEELNDFLPEGKRKVRFDHKFRDRLSVKDLIESLGVPHTEVDLILINGKSVNFECIVTDGDDISVYPVFESFDIAGVQHLRPEPLRNLKFVLDVHLGKLAKYMRMLGLDTAYENNYRDEEIVKISLDEKRAILTKDLGILKRKEVTHGYWIRNINVEKQVAEVIDRFDLRNELNQLTRCLKCNGMLEEIEKEKIVDKIPPKVKKYQDEYFICRDCGKVYWPGSHYERMTEFIGGILGTRLKDGN
ncbi:Mut7-C RNAse domain-containing protein [Bacteroidota bacterium]